MGLQKRYTLTTFSLIGYLLGSQSGKDQFNRYISPFLSQGIRDFHYTYKESPLSDWPWPIVLCFGYLISIHLLQGFMQNRSAYNLKYFRIAHNAFLCFGSFIMVLGMAKEIIKAYQIGGAEALYCDSNDIQFQQTDLYNWYYIFFLSKFYEFIDTYILILRKKPVIFLHSFHHFITAYICWLGLYDHTAIQWTVIGLNGTVHVFMYYYYLAVSCNSDVWWKKHITSLQITQFVIDLIAGWPFFYSILVLGKKCSGTVQVLGFSHLVLLSFLLLFINFYRSAYKPSKSGDQSPETKSKAH